MEELAKLARTADRTEKKNNKKLIAALLLLVVFAAIVMCSCSKHSGDADSNVKGSENDEYDFQITQGEEQHIDIDGNGKEVKWKSKDKNIATVDKNGNIVAGEPGETEIIVKSNGKTYTYKVKVEEKNKDDKSKKKKSGSDKESDKEKAKKKSDSEKKQDKKANEEKSEKKSDKKTGKETEKTAKSEVPAIRVANVSAKPGAKEVAVTVDIENNPGVLGMLLQIHYDSDALTLRKASNGSAFKDILDLTKGKTLQDGCKFIWDGIEISDDQILDGTVLTLYFDISPGADAGVYDISFSYDDGDIISGELEPIKLSVINGSITVGK